MTAEKNSLLVSEIGGQLFQILGDESALYVIRLGLRRGGISMYRALNGPEDFVPGPNAQRIPKSRIGMVHIRTGWHQTEISINTADDERTWRMDERIPDEAVRRIFGGLELFCEEIPAEELWIDAEALSGAESGFSAEGEPVDLQRVPPVRSGELFLDAVMTALAILLPAFWWSRQSGMLSLANLLYFPAALMLLARCEGTRSGRFSPLRLVWLLPGCALTLMHARLNLPDMTQILLPSVTIALGLTALYVLLCGEKRRWRKVAVVLAVCLLTYAPGASLSVNAFGGEIIRTSRVVPRFVRTDWIEAPLDGRQQRFYVRPDICRELSVNLPCELQLRRGAMGIEYWTVVPWERPNEV